MLKKLLFIISAPFFFSIYLNGQVREAPKREFRGVWVATVANIDWPSKPGLSTETQQMELIRLLDEHKRSGINAIMFQIRPAADAFYARGREQWSRFLTGKQGLAPQPFYDPLDFAIQEAHKRGMELHGWVNPYRATTDLLTRSTHLNHITREKPEWFFTYDGKKHFNPGIPEVRNYITDVIMDVVKNYDIDGIHFDDYFYPYPVANKPLPDRETYYKYGSRSFNSIEDWRRHNVDTLIKTLNAVIHKEKKYVKFGISPFGIWRNRAADPEGSVSSGLQGYSALYADARKWVQEGWVDYINPQVYFPFYYRAAPYEKLVDWWSNNAYGKHVYIGQGAYRAMESREGWRERNQIPRQIRYLRQNNRVQGSVFFSSKSLTNNLAGVQDSLRADFYHYPALQPAMLWLDAIIPNPPKLLKSTIQNKCVYLNWQVPEKAKDGDTAYGFVIYRFTEVEEIRFDRPQNIIKISFDAKNTTFLDEAVIPRINYRYVVTSIDRLKNESEPSNLIRVTIPN
ncbi:MAG TPA: family 10 glycosylhydrolase [Sphingobacteriaceae bacterium]|nr:family 10 glycosylhydrolase [Sphingobacteriaceae bacterium]